ncbi:cytochrome P450 [Ceratobasidium sp. AG-I]|nr:cytochrome P450 [Ceratobasidium sp. AG-I]
MICLLDMGAFYLFSLEGLSEITALYKTWGVTEANLPLFSSVPLYIMFDGISNAQLGTAAAVITAIPLFRLFYTSLLPKPIPGVPHNPVTTIWGDIPHIKRETEGRSFGEHLTDEINKHGPIFEMFLGRDGIVVISDHVEAERILVHGKTTEQATRTIQMFATVIPSGQIALPTNEAWKRHRRLLGPSMSKRYLDRMFTRIAGGANNLARLWGAKLELVGVGAFDADLDLQLATMDTIVNIMTGTSAGSIDAAYDALPPSLPTSTSIARIPPSPSPPLHASIRAMMASIEYISETAFPSLSARLEWISPTWRKHYTNFSTFFDAKIAEAKEKKEENTGLATDAECVVDMAVQREGREGMGSMGREELVDELMTYVIGGQDTSASALAWYVKFVAKDPDIQHRLYDEVCAVFGQEEDLNAEAIDDSGRMPMLEAVITETLRRGQVASMMGRELLEDTVILGKFIPKNTALLFPTGVMSNQESSWGSDVDKWNPRRWLNSDGSFNRTAGPNFPFGFGQRACFGQKLAIFQLKIFVATLSRAFYFREVPEEVDTFAPMDQVTRQPKICYVSLQRWDQKS